MTGESILPRLKLEWWMVALTIMAINLVIAAGFYLAYDHLEGYWKDLAPNVGAGFIDIVAVALGFGFYEQHRNRRDDIARLRERIEDVKRFDDPRAHSILSAAIRGLARHGVTNVDLRGAHLSSFSFAQNGISSLAGAVISDGLYLTNEMRNFAQFRSVDFLGVDCRDMCFGSGNLSFATFENCTFSFAALGEARFDGTTLRWDPSNVIADESGWKEVVDEAEDGSPVWARKYSPAFEGADLSGCSFKGVKFQNADFRGARNIDKANFEGAEGLITCYFDAGQRPQTWSEARKPILGKLE